MTTQRPNLSELTSDECYTRLRAASFGRLGLIVRDYPVIIPLNYALDRDVIVFTTASGSVLSLADHQNVTFQIDDVHPADRTGWSVLVRGMAEQVRPDQDREVAMRSAESGVDSFARAEDLRWMRVIPHGITGRRVGPAHPPDDWSLGWAAYV